jgi:hypothetical protein
MLFAFSESREYFFMISPPVSFSVSPLSEMSRPSSASSSIETPKKSDSFLGLTVLYCCIPSRKIQLSCYKDPRIPASAPRVILFLFIKNVQLICNFTAYPPPSFFVVFYIISYVKRFVKHFLLCRVNFFVFMLTFLPCIVYY